MKALNVTPIINSEEISEQIEVLFEYVGEARMSGDNDEDESLQAFVDDLPKSLQLATRKIIKTKAFWSIDPEVSCEYSELGIWKGEINFVSDKLTEKFVEQISDYFKSIGANEVICTWTSYPDDWYP